MGVVADDHHDEAQIKGKKILQTEPGLKVYSFYQLPGGVEGYIQVRPELEGSVPCTDLYRGCAPGWQFKALPHIRHGQGRAGGK